MKNRFLFFFRNLPGYYTLSVNSEDTLPLLNALMKSELYFRPVGIIGDRYVFKVPFFLYGKCVALSSDIGIKTDTVSATGIPFIIYKYKTRLGLAIGTVIFLLLTVGSMFFVWDVSVTGNNNIPEEKIIGVLESLGIRRGTFIPSIDVPGSDARLILALDELSSASVNISGTHIDVDVIERVRKPDIKSNEGIYDIVASESGTVISIEAFEGKPAVQMGDTVAKDQILVNGKYISKREVTMLVHSRAVVRAVVRKKFVTQIPLTYSEKIYTGNSINKTIYTVYGKEFKTYLGDAVRYTYYDTEMISSDISLFSLYLPITKTVFIAREYEIRKTKLSENEAREKAISAFKAWCAEFGADLMNADYVFSVNELTGKAELTGYADIVTDIAKEVPTALP